MQSNPAKLVQDQEACFGAEEDAEEDDVDEPEKEWEVVRAVVTRSENVACISGVLNREA